MSDEKDLKVALEAQDRLYEKLLAAGANEGDLIGLVNLAKANERARLANENFCFLR